MSNHNYTQYSNINKNNEPKAAPVEEVAEVVSTVAPIEETVVVNEAPEITVVEETVETVTLPDVVVGTVTNCSKLNVRVAPVADAEVVSVLDANTEVEINVADSTDEWFSVCTAAGVDGYCMKKFVNANV